MSAIHHHDDPSDPSAPYVIQLLFASPPSIDRAAWAEAVSRSLEQPVEAKDEDGRFVLSLPGLISRLPEGDVPAQATLTTGAVFAPERVAEALSQTWDWPEAEECVAQATCGVVVGDWLAGGLERATRLRLVHAMVHAVIAQATPIAIHWVASQRIVEPAFYHDSLHHEGGVADAAVNVRLYRIADGVPGETVMDTLGLAPFGLPDLQIHFTGLDPSALAPLLLHYAEYLFENGDVLDDDAMIRGIEDSDEWLVERERALAPPLRDVIDIRADNHRVKHG